MLTKPKPGDPATIEVGGKTLTLRYPFRVLRDLQKNHGIAILDDARAALVDADKLVILIHAGIAVEQPDVTIDWVLDNFETRMIPEIMPTVAYAVSGVWPKRADEFLPNGLASDAAAIPGIPGLTFGRSDDSTLDKPKLSSGT